MEYYYWKELGKFTKQQIEIIKKTVGNKSSDFTVDCSDEDEDGKCVLILNVRRWWPDLIKNSALHYILDELTKYIIKLRE